MVHPQADRQRVFVRDLRDRAAVGLVVVLQPEQRQHGRPMVGVIGPDTVLVAEVLDSRPDVAGPRAGDLVLDVAVVPREALARPRRDRRAGCLGYAGYAAGGEEEPVRV